MIFPNPNHDETGLGRTGFGRDEIYPEFMDLDDLDNLDHLDDGMMVP